MSILTLLNPSKTRESILTTFQKAVTDLLALADAEDLKAGVLRQDAMDFEGRAQTKRDLAAAAAEEAGDCRAIADRISALVGTGEGARD